MIMSNKLYDVLKKIVMYVLPALSALYCAIAGIWHLGYVNEMVGTITAFTAFLGVILDISSNSYKAKNEDVTPKE